MGSSQEPTPAGWQVPGGAKKSWWLRWPSGLKTLEREGVQEKASIWARYTTGSLTSSPAPSARVGARWPCDPRQSVPL